MVQAKHRTTVDGDPRKEHDEKEVRRKKMIVDYLFYHYHYHIVIITRSNKC
jgi:hypothetical protein